MTTTAVDVTVIAPITHAEGIDLGREEYRRFADALARLAPDDWNRPTDCEGWTVRDLAGHVVGAMRSAASMRELIRQQREVARRVKRHGGSEVDHMTALQVEIAADLTPEEVVAECRRLVEPAAAGRSRTPALMRRLVSFPVEIGSLSEKWKLGYLLDIILTRDIWMHRVDLARATGTAPDHDPDHDGRIVAEIVAEWARRHGRPFDLTLTGEAGGHFLSGEGGSTLTEDATEFCRMLSGRTPGEGLLAQEVPF